MKRILGAFLLSLLLAEAAMAQRKFPAGIEKFAARAEETTDVSLDKSMLNFASKFLSSREQDQQARRIIASLEGIYVRSYEFNKPGAYTAAEIAALRQQFQGPGWSHIVSVRGKGSDGDTDIFMHLGDGQIKGMLIIAAEPQELTFVNILGPIKPEDLKELSGQFGIPQIRSPKNAQPEGKSK